MSSLSPPPAAAVDRPGYPSTTQSVPRLVEDSGLSSPIKLDLTPEQIAERGVTWVVQSLRVDGLTWRDPVPRLAGPGRSGPCAHGGGRVPSESGAAAVTQRAMIVHDVGWEDTESWTADAADDPVYQVTARLSASTRSTTCWTVSACGSAARDAPRHQCTTTPAPTGLHPRSHGSSTHKHSPLDASASSSVSPGILAPALP